MITNLKEFRKKLNEDVNAEINSDKALKIADYENDIKYYKTNQRKLESILSLDSEKWEEEANKIINNNKYMGIYWKLIKAQKQTSDMEEKLKNSELTEEEKKNMSVEFKELQDNEILLKRQLETDIKKDIDNIKKL